MTAIPHRPAVVPVVRSALSVVVTLAALATVVGALPWLSGDDPARTVLRARSSERAADPAALVAIRTELGIADDPLTGTLRWLAGALHGDFGQSWVTGAPVSSTVVSALGVSLTLATAAAVVCLAGALLILAPSLWRATRTGRAGGHGGAAVGSVLAALPEFLLATLLLAVVAVHWDLAPTSGWEGPKHLVLPALALGLPAAGVLSRVLSGTVETTLAEPWVRTWHATGFRRSSVVAAVLHRAVAVALPQLVLLVVGLLGSAVVIETMFAIPGLGATALRAVLAQDLPLVQACVAALATLGLGLGAAGIVAHRRLMGPALNTAGMTPGSPSRSARTPRWLLGVAVLLTAVVVAGLFRDPHAIALTDQLRAPAPRAPLGTDALGRDLLARFGHGALLSVGTSLAISAVSLVVGLLVGMAGHHGRAGAADVLNAVPPVLAGVVVTAVTGPGLLSAGVAVSLVAWIPLAVHTRTLAAETRAAGFVQAAVVGGAGHGTIVFRHLLPTILPSVARHALVRIPHNALALAGLGFLGLAAPHDSPEWGAMLSQSLPYVETAPWTVAVPATGLALLGLLAGSVRTRGD